MVYYTFGTLYENPYTNLDQEVSFVVGKGLWVRNTRILLFNISNLYSRSEQTLLETSLTNTILRNLELIAGIRRAFIRLKYFMREKLSIMHLNAAL